MYRPCSFVTQMAKSMQTIFFGFHLVEIHPCVALQMHIFWCCVSEIFVWTDMVITSVELAVHVYASFGDPFSRSQIWNNAEVHLPVLSVSWLPSCSNRYLVTFSPLTDNREDPQAIIIWDVRTGQKKRGFHCESQTTWPIFKWVVIRGRGSALPILCNLFVSNVASWETESNNMACLKGNGNERERKCFTLIMDLIASNMWVNVKQDGISWSVCSA